MSQLPRYRCQHNHDEVLGLGYVCWFCGSDDVELSSMLVIASAGDSPAYHDVETVA